MHGDIGKGHRSTARRANANSTRAWRWSLAAIVFIGFAPSFYLRGIVTVPRPNPSLPPSILLHGILFSAWMLLIVAQTQLVAANRRDLHMKLGVAGFLLALAIVPLMYLSSIWQVARANQPPFTDPLNWSVVPLLVIPVIVSLLAIGWTNRRTDSASHKRAMIATAIVMMDPAIGRLPIVPPVLGGFAMVNLLALAMFVPLMLHDRRQLGHVHRVTIIAAGLFAAALVARLAFLATGSWAPIAAHLPGI